jgi:hypothetical protein
MLVLNRFLSPPNMFKDRLRMFQFMWFLSLWISVSEISILGQTLTPFHSHDVLIISIHSQKFWNKEINFGDFSFLKSSLLFEDLIECSKSGLSNPPIPFHSPWPLRIYPCFISYLFPVLVHQNDSLGS